MRIALWRSPIRNVLNRSALNRSAVAVVTAGAVVAAGLLLPQEAQAATPSSGTPETVPAASDPAAQPVIDVLQRWVGEDAGLFDVTLSPSEGADGYSVSASGGRVSIEATTPATALAGFNAYIGDVLHQSVSWNGSNLDLPDQLPDTAPITSEANVTHRFVNNDVEDGYTGPYRSLEDWKKLVDVYAMHGLNEVFMPVGAEAVYADMLGEFGYSDAEIQQWIPQAGHQPWWLLQNMSSSEDPLTSAQIDRRAELGHEIADYIRDLGMTPVLPGYFGTVPTDFAEHAAESGSDAAVDIVPQGTWAGGYQRPDWLDPNSEIFSDVAQAFYDASDARLGATTMYKADVLHEGGTAGDADVPGATRAIEDAMQTAHEGATWVLLGWQSNPPDQVVETADPETTFIVDGLSDRYDDLDRDAQWDGIPYAFGSIWNFGGHTTMGAQTSVQNERYFQWLDAPESHMDGVAILPEGGENNPAEFDFLAGLAWSDGAVDLEDWFADFAHRRYGASDENAAAAWDVLRRTAYDLPSDDGWSEAADSLYGAVPSLKAQTAAAWSPTTQRYDTEEFEKALPLLLDVGEEASATDTYRYDLMDVARQVMANTARTLLPKIKDAYDDGSAQDFATLTEAWLDDMELVDEIAGTDDQQLLGSWIEEAREASGTDAEADAAEKDARQIVSTWTPADGGLTDLNDYANREWNGLVGGYYQARWGTYFDYLSAKLAGEDPNAPNFGQMGADFVAGDGDYEPDGGYATEPSGDLAALAQTAVDRAEFADEFEPEPQPLPEPPGAGETYLSDLEFVSEEYDDAYGPAARDTEIGEPGSDEREPITLGGETYEKGLGVNSPSSIVFNLGGRCTAFDAQVGIDGTMDLPGKTPQVIFSVLGDGEELYSSGSFSGGGDEPADPETVSVDVSGVDLLTLEVDPDGSTWFDRADWADARVTCADDDSDGSGGSGGSGSDGSDNSGSGSGGSGSESGGPGDSAGSDTGSGDSGSADASGSGDASHSDGTDAHRGMNGELPYTGANLSLLVGAAALLLLGGALLLLRRRRG